MCIKSEIQKKLNRQQNLYKKKNHRALLLYLNLISVIEFMKKHNILEQIKKSQGPIIVTKIIKMFC